MNKKELKKLNEREINNINGGGIGLVFVESVKNKNWTGKDSAVTIVGGLLALWGLVNFKK